MAKIVRLGIWPRILSLPGAKGGFVGDPTSLARDNIYLHSQSAYQSTNLLIQLI